jgi:hypothetical protein
MFDANGRSQNDGDNTDVQDMVSSKPLIHPLQRRVKGDFPGGRPNRLTELSVRWHKFGDVFDRGDCFVAPLLAMTP